MLVNVPDEVAFVWQQMEAKKNRRFYVCGFFIIA